MIETKEKCISESIKKTVVYQISQDLDQRMSQKVEEILSSKEILPTGGISLFSALTTVEDFDVYIHISIQQFEEKQLHYEVFTKNFNSEFQLVLSSVNSLGKSLEREYVLPFIHKGCDNKVFETEILLRVKS